MIRYAKRYGLTMSACAILFSLFLPLSQLYARDWRREILDVAGPRALCLHDPQDIYRELLRDQAVKDRLNKGFQPYVTADVDVNEVAVVEDDGTVILPPNRVDLADLSIRFSPSANGYNVTLIPPAFDADLGTRITLDDDDTRPFNLGFNFPFYGRSYDNLWLNSDGNLTFTAGDSSSASARDALRHLSGPPRLSPFLQDLDPSDPGIPAGGGVFFRLSGDRAAITWNQVPQFRFSVASPLILNSLQVVVYIDGVIDFSYMTLRSTEGITGISPGGLTFGRLVKFTRDLPLTDVNEPIYEEFRSFELLSLVGAVRKYLRSHADAIDFVVMFTNFPFGSDGAFAFERPIANHTRGLGYRNRFPIDTFDFSSSFGSLGRLSSLVFMFSESQYPEDPRAPIVGLGTNNTLSILGQEIGHRWGAFVHFLRDGVRSRLLLGRDNSHWSFHYNSLASNLEGNEWRDEGGGNFTSIAATARFSPLDQYLMGLRPKAEVPPSFVITNPSAFQPGNPPRINVAIRGERLNVSIDDVVAAEGDREPDVSRSSQSFTGAFILLTRNGVAPSEAVLNKIARIRQAWEEYFPVATDGRGQFFTQLDGLAEGGTPTVINFPYLGQGVDHFTGLAVTNRSLQKPATLTLTAYNDEGQLISLPGMPNPKRYSVLPQMQTARLGFEVFSIPSATPIGGWVQATVSHNEVSSFFLAGAFRETGEARALDGAVVNAEVSNRLIFTRVLDGPYLNQTASTELYIVNPNNEPTILELTLYRPDGAVAQRRAEVPLAGHGRLTGNLRALFPGATFPQIGGSVEVTATQPLVGFELSRYRTEFSSLSAQIPNEARRLYSAHFASGYGGAFFTEINLVNTTGSPTTVTLTLIGDDGQPVTGSGITNPLRNRVIAAHASLTGTLTALFGFPNPVGDTGLRSGSVIIEASAAGLVGDVLFGDPNNGTVMSDLPLNNRLVTEAVFSQVAQGSLFFTGLAAMNPNAQAVTLTITVYQANGLRAGLPHTRTLAPGTRFSKLLYELVPETVNQVGGYIHVRCEGGGVALYEIFGDSGLANFNAAVPPQVVSYAEP